MRLRSLWILLLVLLILPGISSLFKPGFYQSQDGWSHVVRLAKFTEALLAGQFPVRWASGLAYELGSPIFNFNFPFPYYLGALLHAIGFSFTGALEVIFGASLVGAGIFFFLWMRQYVHERDAFSGALFFVVWAPYQFLNMYHRAALGETIALAILPLLFLFIDQIRMKKTTTGIIGFAITYALIILSHNVSALTFSGILMLYVLWRHQIFQPHLSRLLLALLLGIGLAAFFWLPAIVEVKWTQLPVLATTTFRTNFPPLLSLIRSKWEGGSVFDGKTISMSFQIGLVHLTIIGLSAIHIIRKRRVYLPSHVPKDKLQPIFWLLLIGLSLFLMQPISTPLYTTIPLMNYLLYPWRFLGIIVFATAVLAAWLFSTVREKWTIIPMIILLLYANRNHIQIRPAEISDVFLKTPIVSAGDMTDEFLPPWTDRVIRTVRADTVGVPFPPIEIVTGNGVVFAQAKRGTTITGRLALESASRVRINQYYFPGWVVEANGHKLDLVTGEENGGRIDITLPQGTYTIHATLTDTPVRSIGNVVSVGSLIGVAFLLRANK